MKLGPLLVCWASQNEAVFFIQELVTPLGYEFKIVSSITQSFQEASKPHAQVLLLFFPKNKREIETIEESLVRFLQASVAQPPLVMALVADPSLRKHFSIIRSQAILNAEKLEDFEHTLPLLLKNLFSVSKPAGVIRFQDKVFSLPQVNKPKILESSGLTMEERQTLAISSCKVSEMRKESEDLLNALSRFLKKQWGVEFSLILQDSNSAALAQIKEDRIQINPVDSDLWTSSSDFGSVDDPEVIKILTAGQSPKTLQFIWILKNEVCAFTWGESVKLAPYLVQFLLVRYNFKKGALDRGTG